MSGRKRVLMTIRIVCCAVCLVFLSCRERFYAFLQEGVLPADWPVYYYSPRTETDVHIFIDDATYPTIQQAVEILQLPDSTPKIIMWSRYPDQQAKLIRLGRKNVIEWRNLYEKSSQNGMDDAWQALRRLLISCPKAKIVLHANEFHFGRHALYLLERIPAQNLKEIHLYEDGAGSFYRQYRHFQYKNAENDQLMARFKSYFDNGRVYVRMRFAQVLSQLYPTVIHSSFADKIGVFRRFPFRLARVVPVDFYQLKKNLPADIKSKLFYFFGFNEREWVDSMKEKTVGVLLMNGQPNRLRMALFKCLFQKIDQNKHEHQTQWLLKLHPAIKDGDIKKNRLQVVPAKVPFEVLLLSDLNIRFVAGEGSSAFFAVKPEMIAGYIPHINCFYKDLLMELGILSRDKVIK